MSIHVSVVFDSLLLVRYYWVLGLSVYPETDILGVCKLTKSIIPLTGFPNADSWNNSEEQHPLLWHGDGSGAFTQRTGKIWWIGASQLHIQHCSVYSWSGLNCRFVANAGFWHCRRPSQKRSEEHGQRCWSVMSWLHTARRRNFRPGESDGVTAH